MLIFPLQSSTLNVEVKRGATSLDLYTYVTVSLKLSLAGITTVNITVPSNVVLQGLAAPAVLLGNWPSTVTVNLINNGLISGFAGGGGNGGIKNEAIAPTAGSNGGTAIFCTVDCGITNNGTIQGGAGGGGGGAYSINGDGGGGGGGQGVNSLGGFGNPNGSAGTLTAGGAGGLAAAALAGNGGNGGTWASGGDGIGQAGGNSAVSGGAGGNPGKAIDYNGKTVGVTNNGTISGATS